MRIARRKPMFVTFLRAGERRYSVRVAVEGEPVLELNTAPGYDPLMPHDLQHFIVERALGIEGGVYGQLAAGRTAGLGSISKAYRAINIQVAAGHRSARRRREGGESESANHGNSRRSTKPTVPDPNGRLISACTIG